jgi:ABC-type molybdate transport system ATPase subunit
MYGLLKSVRAHTGVTALHVTHSLGEAHRLADKLLLLADGRVAEAPLPRPADGPAAATAFTPVPPV